MSKRRRRYYYKKMMEYKNAENKLSSKLENISSSLRECEESLSRFPNVYSNSDSEGQVIDDFNNKSEKFGRELKDILEKANNSKETVNEKKDLAHERYLYYRELYEND